MPDTDVGEVIDRRALSAYRRRLTELEEDLRWTGSAGERARVAVRKAVAAAIDRIEQMDPRARRVAA
jgi:hypothetical protein